MDKNQVISNVCRLCVDYKIGLTPIQWIASGERILAFSNS